MQCCVLRPEVAVMESFCIFAVKLNQEVNVIFVFHLLNLHPSVY